MQALPNGYRVPPMYAWRKLGQETFAVFSRMQWTNGNASKLICTVLLMDKKCTRCHANKAVTYPTTLLTCKHTQDPFKNYISIDTLRAHSQQ